MDEQESTNVLSLPVSDLALTNRAYNCLYRNGITRVSDLVSRTREELLALGGMGIKSIRGVERTLNGFGLHLGMNGERSQPEGANAPSPVDVTSLTIDDLDLTIRSYNSLSRKGIVHVRDLTKMSRTELFAVRGMGRTSVRDVEAALKKLGLRLDLQGEELTAAIRAEDAARIDLDAFIGVINRANENGVSDVGELIRMSRDDFLTMPGVDRSTLEILESGLSKWGLRLGMNEYATSSRTALETTTLETFKDELSYIVPRLLPSERSSESSCFISYHGVTGDSTMTLQELADNGFEHGFGRAVTRQRVQQILVSAERKLRCNSRHARFRRWEPAVEEARSDLPISVQSFASRFGYESPPDSESVWRMLKLCADIFKLDFPFENRALDGFGTLVVDPSDHVTLKDVSRLGGVVKGRPYADMVEIVEQLGCSGDIIRRTIEASSRWEFLDDDYRYFWKRPHLPPQNYCITGNAILTCLCKIFSVTRRAMVSDLVASVVRDRALRIGDSIPKLPVSVLEGVAERSGLFDVYDGVIFRKDELEWCSLGRRDAVLLKILLDRGRVVTSDVIYSQLVRSGFTQENASATVAYSPFLIHSYSGRGPKRGIYKFVPRQEEIDRETIDARIVDTEDGDDNYDDNYDDVGSVEEVARTCLRIPISSRTRMSGKYHGSESIGLDGEWNVLTDDGVEIGRVIVDDQTVIGLGPVISELSLKKDDVLELRVDGDARIFYVAGFLHQVLVDLP